MSHDYHKGPDDAVLFDGCEECDERAANPLNALLNLDADNFERLHDRVLDVERRYEGAYRSRNEAAVGKALNQVMILIERHPEALAR